MADHAVLQAGMHEQQRGAGEEVGGEPRGRSENMDGILSSVIICSVTLHKSISSPTPTNELVYLGAK